MSCLDEAGAVGACVREAREAMAAHGIDGEVVVDNGSTDGSPEIAAAAGARVVHGRRSGYGSAYLRGLREVRGRDLDMGDADG
jgi:glycosyltransferase involved in cell wall biosynthesis